VISTFLAIILFLSQFGPPCPPPETLLYHGETGIWIRDMVTGQEVQLAARAPFDLSTDGKLVWWNSEASDGPRLQILDLHSGEARDLASSSRGCWQAIWPPQGSEKLLVVCRGKQHAQIGIISTADDSLQILAPRLHASSGMGLLPLAWFPDGLSFLCWDKAFLYRMNLEGEVIYRRPVDSVSRGLVYGGLHDFALGPDGESLLLAREIQEGDPEESRLCFLGPENHEYRSHMVIVLHNLRTGNSTIVSPPGFDASQPSWCPCGQALVFSGFDERGAENEGVHSLFLAQKDGSQVQEILPGKSGKPFWVKIDLSKIGAAKQPVLRR
jgi:hypothetical protein